MHLQELSARALAIRGQYAEMEVVRYGRAWTREEVMLGFVGDVGDLAKLVLAQAGVRNITDAEAKLAHELADCLWAVLVLAQQHGVDLEAAFLQTMEELEERLKDEG